MYIALFLLWVVLNGQWNLEIVCLGIVITSALFWFCCKFLNYSIQSELIFYRLLPHMAQYVLVLLWEIIKANVDAMKLALSFRYEIDPVVVKFQTDLRTDLAKAVLANSITLTPGTITVALEGDEFTIHALDVDLISEMNESVFVKHLRKMESIAVKYTDKKEK